ncbi:Hypothetical protein, putative [Bodo saltans]|uniref:C2 domain-containing protein n=1 Tax=Bodo saltans TaxID=75058 RepID=A0A0S4J857_BODSA|nr:Hypothetical protein, putative [Bodo saltans]|eukprot:CUG87579.1 Hypothetical protein, putative [Bodo saltans]
MKKVSLIECRSFPGKDPFVRAFYPDDESLIFESSVKKNNPNATWKESFFCLPSHSSTIRFACHDHRGGNSVFVGNVVVDLSVDGVKTVELLKAALVFEVETVKQGKNMLSVHINSVRGCEGPLLCRGVYASSVIAEFEISAFPTFTFEPIGGHAGFEVSLWRRGEPSPVASALVDLRVGGRQEIQCDGCVMPISLIVDVLSPSSASWRPSGATICVSQLVTNVPVDRWQVRTDDGLSSWLLPQDYWCFNSQSKNLTLEILTSDGHGVVNLELGEALESTPNNFSITRGVLRDGIDGYIEWSWSSQPEWSLGKPTSTDTHSAGARDRREKECRLSLKVLGIVAFSPGTVTITCGSSVTAKIGHAKQGFSALSKSLHATVAPPMHHALFSLSLDSKGEFFGQLSPFHLPNEGRRWVTLERGGDVGGFVEVEWLSVFESHSYVDCEDLNVVSEIEVVEAQALSSSDLGGTCNAFCVLQALPVSDACRLCSPIVKSSVNPLWSWNVSLTLKATSGIVVNVLDADSTGDEFLGFLSLPANSFFWKCETGDCWLPLADQPTGQLERHCGAKGVLTKPSGTYTQAVASGECEILFDNIEIGGMTVASLRVGEQVFFATSSALVSSAQAQSLVQGGVIPIEVVSASGDLFSGSVVLSKLTVKRKLFHIAITSLTAQPLVMVSEIQLLWFRF